MNAAILCSAVSINDVLNKSRMCGRNANTVSLLKSGE